MSNLFETAQDTLNSGGAKYVPTDGLHQASIVGLVDLGMQEQTNDKGEQYEIRKMEILFAIDEKNPSDEYMVVRRTVSVSMGDNSILKKITTDAGWDWNIISDLLGKKCQVLTQIVKTKAGKDFPKVANILKGDGFVQEGKVVVPYWYADNLAEGTLALADGVEIGEKGVSKSKGEAPANPVNPEDKATMPFSD